MAFYTPRANRTTQFQNVRAQQQGAPVQTGMVSTSQVPQQQQSGVGLQDIAGLYKAGKEGSGLLDKAGTLIGKWTIPSGINPESVLAGSGVGQNAAFLGGGEAAGSFAPTMANNSAFLGAAAENPLSTSAIGGNVGWLGGGMNAAGMAGGTEAAGTAAATTAGNAAAATGAEAAGAAAAGAESASALGLLGPIGLAAGIGLLGTKLFGLW